MAQHTYICPLYVVTKNYVTLLSHMYAYMYMCLRERGLNPLSRICFFNGTVSFWSNICWLFMYLGAETAWTPTQNTQHPKWRNIFGDTSIWRIWALRRDKVKDKYTKVKSLFYLVKFFCFKTKTSLCFWKYNLRNFYGMLDHIAAMYILYVLLMYIRTYIEIMRDTFKVVWVRYGKDDGQP